MGSKYQDSLIFGRLGGGVDGHTPLRAQACARVPEKGVEFRGSLAPFFFSTSFEQKKNNGDKLAPIHHIHFKFLERNLCEALY